MNLNFTLAVSAFAIAALGASDPAFAKESAKAKADALPAVADKDPYFVAGQKTLAARRLMKPNTKKAKNVILFLGDGMDPTTVAAARIFDGQSQGKTGEENFLSFETFPYVAFSKTYNTNAQVPDSAGTMSAIVTGLKTKAGVLSVTDAAKYGDCASGRAAETASAGLLAKKAKMALGIVTTTRITHATPAAVYAHSASRDWEGDGNLSEAAQKEGCRDIARQLLEFTVNGGPEVVLGGGRAKFLPAEMTDPEYPDRKGERRDGRDLTSEWTARSADHKFVWNRASFNAVDPTISRPRLLGLFDTSHMQYEADRAADRGGEPSLAEMTAKAIDILAKEKNGYFLMVEAGRIDHAHHAGNAARALMDTQALSRAVEIAMSKTSDRDTLIIVTADHGHTLSFAGYPQRGTPILGLATSIAGGEGGDSDGEHALAADKKPYTTLGYANGPGSVFSGELKDGKRPAPRAEEVKDVSYRQQSVVPMGSETHGGQDVTIYASGPRAYLLGGVVEQNYIFHVIDDALDLRKRAAKAK
jgi:alkaline phosphatase